jgi:hypothetical protein
VLLQLQFMSILLIKMIHAIFPLPFFISQEEYIRTAYR